MAGIRETWDRATGKRLEDQLKQYTDETDELLSAFAGRVRAIEAALAGLAETQKRTRRELAALSSAASNAYLNSELSYKNALFSGQARDEATRVAVSCLKAERRSRMAIIVAILSLGACTLMAANLLSR